jgi:hypothetical protein
MRTWACHLTAGYSRSLKGVVAEPWGVLGVPVAVGQKTTLRTGFV